MCGIFQNNVVIFTILTSTIPYYLSMQATISHKETTPANGCSPALEIKREYLRWFPHYCTAVDLCFRCYGWCQWWRYHCPCRWLSSSVCLDMCLSWHCVQETHHRWKYTNTFTVKTLYQNRLQESLSKLPSWSKFAPTGPSKVSLQEIRGEVTGTWTLCIYKVQRDASHLVVCQ